MKRLSSMFLERFKADGVSYYADSRPRSSGRPNQDAYLCMPDIGVFGVFDGFYKGGEKASQLAADTIEEHYKNIGRDYDSDNDITRNISAALQAANIAIINFKFDNPPEQDFGTTASIIQLIPPGQPEKIARGHLGDSRIYVSGDEELDQITIDETPEIDEDADISEEKRRQLENTITNCLGYEYSEINEYPLMSLKAKKKIFLCTDGITGNSEYTRLGVSEVLMILSHNSPKKCVLDAFAHSRKRDDKTAIVVNI